MKSYEQFLESSNDALIIVGRDNVIIFLNKAAIQLLDQPEKPVLGRNLLDILGRRDAFSVNKTTRFTDGAIVHIAPKNLQNNFSAIIHQLKAPLAAFKWTMEDMLEENLSAHQKDQLSDLYKTNQFLIDLVNDLLSIHKFESGALKLNRAPADIVKTMNDILKIFKPIADKKKQKIIIDFGKQYIQNIDQSLFTIVFQNLLDNAINYAPEGAKIAISLSPDKQNNIILSIRNEGSIISEEDKPKIFSKFYRAEEAKKIKPGGSGLGLYIAKLAAEANGGRIWFESSIEKGTTFYFSVPAIY